MNFLKLGLIGYPLSHSRSPAMHTAALNMLGIAGEYRLYPIVPLPAGFADLRTLIERVRAEEIHGLNITIPHKQSVMPLLDVLSPVAREIGAVNTILRHDGMLVGENTDAAGFMADLIRLAPQIRTHDPKIALVLGAGGAARAVIYALLGAGWRVIVAARRLEQAREVISSFRFAGGDTQGTIGFDQLAELWVGREIPDSQSPVTIHGSSIALIVNTTPLGMAPAVDQTPWPEGLKFPEGAVVYDLVYNPLETLFVNQARLAGLAAYSGLGMLVEQAALAFELWTGQDAPRPAMAEAVGLKF